MYIAIMYHLNRSFNIPPGQPPGHLNFWKIFVQIPSPRAEKLFKCPHLHVLSGRSAGLFHFYSTCSSSSGNYYISNSRVNQKNDSFSIRGAKIWNSIPENLRNSSKSLSKEKVHAILLKILEAQDSYADLNTIISDFKKY